MIKHCEFQQNSGEWMVARAGIPTASEFDQLLTPEFKLRIGQTPASYLARKLAERWIGGPLMTVGGMWAMEQGHILEDEAIPWYEFEQGVSIERVGLVTTDDGRVGYSPDGLIGEDGGLEIKCPEAQTHVRYLLDGCVPKDYLCQVHGAMYVTGCPWWRFLSYRRHFPALLVTVERDEMIQERIAEALTGFLARLDEGWARLVDLNGGPPPKREPMQFSSAPPAPDVSDVVS